MASKYTKFSLFAATALGLTMSALTAPAVYAQEDEGASETKKLNTVTVTARRKSEPLQEVPISITVFDQKQLADRNVTTASDLATYTPSLSTNQRFGPDSTTFAIRGFTQELRTTPSVAVYFADVVAPRGGGSISAGEGTGPGRFFDLENVQVLKGPQGTLFGRNTTGGAILLVPAKPKDYVEGYLEGTVGNLGMRRLQGVVNLPFSEKVLFRAGFDAQHRDGYLDNTSGVGPDEMGDISYMAGRASLVVDVTDDIENYTIATFTSSDNSGTVPQLFACNEALDGNRQFGAFYDMCTQQLASQGTGDYVVQNNVAIPDPENTIDQWQIINTTTWKATDDLTVKNVFSYGELETTLRSDVFGANFFTPATFGPYAGLPFTFVNSQQVPGVKTTDQWTLSEEIQIQGLAFDDRLDWQAGLYYEKSEPKNISGSLSANLISCGSFDSLTASDVDTLGSQLSNICVDPFAQLAGLAIDYGVIAPLFAQAQAANPGVPANLILAGLLANLPAEAQPREGFSAGSVQRSLGNIYYENQGIYLQGTYELNDQFSLTAGLRYTKDKVHGESSLLVYTFPYDSIWVPTTQPAYATNCLVTNDPLITVENECQNYIEKDSDAPTWLINLDYKPTSDILLYAKYARGYRQGSINLFGPPSLNTFDPEEVDSYELGLKSSFDTDFARGTFNAAVFYNDFRGQQLQFNVLESDSSNGIGVPTTVIVNAGESTIAGLEMETVIYLGDDFLINGSYTYLDTELKSLDIPEVPEPYETIQPTVAPGFPLTFSPENSFSVTGTWMIPVASTLGDMALSATFTHTDEQISTLTVEQAEALAVLTGNAAFAAAGSPFGELPATDLLNLNFNWTNVFNKPVDLSVFATNVTEEVYPVYVSGRYATGFESAQLSQPRTYGVRVRYSFGG